MARTAGFARSLHGGKGRCTKPPSWHSSVWAVWAVWAVNGSGAVGEAG